MSAPFAAYIVSFLPRDNDELRRSRLAVHQRQLDWWMEKTDVPIYVIAMNYDSLDFLSGWEMGDRVHYVVSEPLKLAPARRKCFDLFYASQHEWGIMMDDDAILYDKDHHNSGPRLLSEMATHLQDYRTIGAFFPINPQKIGFNPLWAKNPQVSDSHVFNRNLDLKGSMFFVRNFRLHGQQEVFPDETFDWQEDTKFAIDMVAAGHHVQQCYNIILNELSGKASHFSAEAAARRPKMEAGNRRIAEQYAGLDLHMGEGDESHLLIKRDFMKRCWRGGTKLIVPKRPDPNWA
jgi:hypothetical protein